jgi:hypothetical protein
VYKIFGQEKLRIVKITNGDLYLVMIFICLFDIILNTIWSTVAPFSSEIVIIDPIRPYYNYAQCSWSSASNIFIYIHLAEKSALIFFGMVLTFASRNVPSAFNETPQMAAAIYNEALIFIFGIPIVAVQLGGRETTYIIRSYGIMFQIVMTMSILFIPKLHGIWFTTNANLVQQLGTQANGTNVTGPGASHVQQPGTPAKTAAVSPLMKSKRYMAAEGHSHTPA